MNCNKALGILFGLLIPMLLVAQEQDITTILIKKYAENSFRDGDYEFALENYLLLYQKDKQNVDLNYRIGICYTEANVNKNAAIPYLEFVLSHNNYPLRTYYYLGRSYMYNYRFTEAVEAFYDFKMIGVNEDLLHDCDRLISKCYYALEKINTPRYVSYTRLDTTINSIHDDYSPCISADNTQLYFTSRKTYLKEIEDYISNVFYSNFKKGMWNSSLSLPVNTYDNEEMVGISPEADRLFIYANGDYFTHDIKMVTRKGNKYMNAFSSELPADLNTEGVEMGAAMSADGNEFIFASDRRGGRGGLDLYKAVKDASGVWSEPINMGSTINSEFDDNFPCYSPDGKKLYFSSNGHLGFGGFDLFETAYSKELQMWTPPKNLGIPINTPLDNKTISFANSTGNKIAYVAANRKEGVGNLDIYRLEIFPDSIPQKFLAGTIMVNTNQGLVPYSEDFLMVYATLYDMFGNIYAQYEVQAEGGQFFASYYPGEYKLELKFSGAKKGFTKKLLITQDTEDFLMETFTLQNVE